MKRSFVLLILLMSAACSDDSGTAPQDDDDVGGGGGVTNADSVWVQNLESVASQMEQWAGESPDTIAARALAYLQSLPSVADAGIVSGTTTVWANFVSGYDLIIPNNREPSGIADTLIDAASVLSSTKAMAPRKVTIPAGRQMMTVLSQPQSALEIPVSPQFRAVNAIGTCHLNPLPVIRSLLTEGGYVSANPPPPTVAGLRSSVHGDGVFYINSHGGPGYDANQSPFYAIWTLDPIDPATLANYKPLLATHELVGMLEWSNNALGQCACVMHYGFTDQFVRRRMSFEKNSLVIVDACSSASGPAAALRQAFQSVGASVYVGWSTTVEAPFAYRSMKYLLDRLLGINKITPENPEQRAFNIDDVRDDMATNRNLVTDPAHNSTLTVFKLKDDFGLLAPSILFLSLESFASSDLLYVAGMFGTDPGAGKRQVTINGASLPVESWQPTLITCDITDDQAGTVVVEIGTGASIRRSNPVNLTSWEGTFVYEHDDPGDLSEEMTMKVHFRADIHSFREKPHEQPFETTVLFNPMHDTSVSVTTEGSYSQTIADCTDTFTQSMGADLRSPFENTIEGGWTYFGSVDTQSHTLQLSMQALAAFTAGTWVRSGDCDAFNRPLFIIMAMEECVFDDLQQTTAFRMQMSDDFTVTADERGPCNVEPLIGELNDLTAQAKIRWNAMTAVFPPDPDAAR